MSVFSTRTKARVGVKTAKQAAKHPKLALRGAKSVTPIVTRVANARARQAQRQAAALLDAVRSIGQTVFEAGRQAAQADVPVKRAAPGIAVGVAVGASAMYLLDPASGAKRRHNLLGLINPTGRSGDHDTEPATDNEAGGPAHPAPGHMPAQPQLKDSSAI